MRLSAVLAMVPVLTLASGCARPSDPPLPAVAARAHCFYGLSISYGSRPAARNGAIFVELTEESGEPVCRVLFHHKSRFYRCAIRGESLARAEDVVLQGTLEIDGETVPLQIETANGKVYEGRIGEADNTGFFILKETGSP